MKSVPTGFARDNTPPPQHAKAVEIFWSHVDKSGGPDACWPWVGRKCKNGYGKYGYKSVEGRITARSNRVAMLLSGVDIGGKYVLHHCDAPACCNPKHLYVGTIIDNTRDRVERKRQPPDGGESKAARSKIFAVAIREIRAARGDKEAITALAARYGMHETNIRSIARGKTFPFIK